MSTLASPPRPVDLDRIRAQFPALAATATVLLENAGGSQVPAVVADAIRDYMCTSFVQLGAGYDVADRCDAVVDGAHDFVLRLVNGESTGKVALGPSSSQLLRMLADGYGAALSPGDEIIVTEAGHEANIAPWMRLADRGFTLETWRIDPESCTSPLAELEKLLTPRTRIVALVHVSNLLGGIVDVAAITEVAHAAGARVVVDGVAYAPHRAIDVAAWNVDWYSYSTYKVYGPHMGVLYGRHDAIGEIEGPNHFFIPRDEVPYKLELGGVNHEGCAGLNALGDYLAFLAALGRGDASARQSADGMIDRATITDAFDLMAACERPLQERLVAFLGDRPGVRVLGPGHGGPERVGTVSFVHASKSAKAIVDETQAAGFGLRHGHMYAHRLCEALGLDPEDGVVRVSFVHYNTLDEIERLIAALDGILPRAG